MDDRFSFGTPAKRPAKLGAAPARRGLAVDPRLLLVVAGLAVAAVLAFVLLRGAGEAGRSAADAATAAVDTVGRAQDAAAQASIGRAVVAARTAFAEQGAFTTDTAALTAFDPSLTFTTGASTGPTSVAVTATADAFGVAVRSDSGSCWWARLDPAGSTTYGSGGTCTGRAALASNAASW
jgi:hypothetical protein